MTTIESPTETTAPAGAGALILDEVRAYISRFVHMPSSAALDAATLWVAHTFAVDKERELVFNATPRLAFLSNGPGSGKTVALEMVTRLARDGVSIADPTGPSMVALISEERATVAVDEIDVLFGTGNGQRAVRTVLNAGAYRGGKIARVRKVESCFGPIALAGMQQNFRTNKNLGPTVSRSIMIVMRPGVRNKIEPYRDRLHGGAAASLRSALASWASSEVMALSTVWPTMPDGVDGRTADMWEPLVTVADVAGGTWPERAREACAAIALGTDEDDADPVLTPAQALLTDVARIWRDEDELTTAVMLDRLSALPGTDYGRRWPNPRAAAMEVAAILRPLGIRPCRLTVAGREVQGYRYDDLADHLPTIEDNDRADMDAPEYAEIV